MTEAAYTLRLTETQAAILCTACEALNWHDELNRISDMLSRHKSETEIAWDLFQVLRHRLEWDRGGDFSITIPASEQPPAKIERSEAA